jgi:hypothetical protein
MTLCWLTAMRAVEQINKAKGGPVLFPWTVGFNETCGEQRPVSMDVYASFCAAQRRLRTVGRLP